MNWPEIVSYIGLGLAAGVLGGLLGIGGSIIMIPAITLIFGKSMHLAQAAAMIVNFFVAVPSALQHHRANAVQWDVVWRTLPFAIILIIIGVEAGNAIDSTLLKRIFGVFLLYVVLNNLVKLLRNLRERRDIPDEEAETRTEWWRVGIVGSIVGFAAGILGIGGGSMAVPLYLRVCRMPLRHGIATSSAVMCLTAVVGAVRKNMTLTFEHNIPLDKSLLIAGCIAPTAFIGSLIGAKLTHILPLFVVRIAFIVLLAITSYEMLI